MDWRISRADLLVWTNGISSQFTQMQAAVGRLDHGATNEYRFESTVRYLGIEVDDALEMAEQTEA